MIGLLRNIESKNKYMTNESQVEILLVEDNMSDAELTIRALKKKNLANNLIHLKNGAEALDFIFAQGEFSGRDMNRTPKVILLDLKMPKINGLEVLAKIKGDERTKKIPVVVLTSSKEDPDIAACYAFGVNSYIVKPVEFDNFLKAVSDLGFYWLLLNQVPHQQSNSK
jgi:two-component system, response regulator